jgi:hypothetical protein
MSSFACYDNDAFYFVTDDDGIKFYRKQRVDGALWQESHLPEDGLVVNDSTHKRVFIKEKEAKLLRIFPCGFGAYGCSLGGTMHKDRKAISLGEQKIKSSPEIEACPLFGGQSDEAIESEIRSDLERAQNQKKLFEEQRRLAKLSLANYACQDTFEAMVKQDILDNLGFLAKYDEADIVLFIQAMLNLDNFFLPDDGEVKSIDIRRKWLMDDDLLSLKLDAFPDKAIFDYLQCVATLLKESFQMDCSSNLVERPRLSAFKTARQYTFDKLFEDFNPEDVELKTILIQTKIDVVRDKFFSRFPQNEANITWFYQALETKFRQDFPEPSKANLREALISASTPVHQVEPQHQLLVALDAFKQFYQASNCPRFLAQWMWNVVSYVYRICAWLDTYCLKLGQGNALMKQFSDSQADHSFFQKCLGLNQHDPFDDAISAHVRQIILG